MDVFAFVCLSSSSNKIKYSTNLNFYALMLFDGMLFKHAHLAIFADTGGVSAKSSVEGEASEVPELSVVVPA